MDLISGEMNEDFDAVGFRNQRRNLRVLPQTAKNKTNISVDRSRKALAAGKRISKNGKIYWETRRSRSDEIGKTI